MKTLQYLLSAPYVKPVEVLETFKEGAIKGISFDLGLTRQVIDKAPLKWKDLTTLRGYFTQGLHKRLGSPLENQPETREYREILEYIGRKIDKLFV